MLLAGLGLRGWLGRVPHAAQPGLVAIAVFGNFGWALACGVVLYSGVLEPAPAGWAWVLGQAAIGVALGDLQCAGLWRSRASLAGPMTAL